MNKEDVLSKLDLHAFYRGHIPSLTGSPQATGRCPFPDHEDMRASFSVNLDTGLFNCHGCDRKGDVFTFYQELQGLDFKTTLREIAGAQDIKETWSDKRITATYDYLDEDGILLYQVCRFEPKDFRPRRKGPDGKWTYNLEGVRRVPYNLPEVMAAPTVIIVEGEKDADNLKALGYAADIAVTTTNGGTKAWRPEYADFFKGKTIAIIPDNDRPGLEYAKTVATSLHRSADVIKIVELPGLGKRTKKHGLDISDWIELRRKEDRTDREIKAELAGLIKETSAWEPTLTVSQPGINSYTSEESVPVPLPNELTPVAAFDLDLLPEAIRPWIEDIAERLQCPPDYVAAGAMTSLASVLGRKIGIRPQARTDWTVTPNLWGLVVGRPGVLKSPALEAALAPIKRLAAKSAEKHVEEMASYEGETLAAKLRAEAAEKAARKKLKEDPNADLSAVLSVPGVDIPTQRRYIASDSTPEALGELLRQNPDGLLVYRDELVSLLKGLDREDRAEGRGFYLTAWNGDSCYTFDRIGRGFNLRIPAVCLSILGSTQPGRLSEYIGHAVRGGAGDDGLIQRFGLLVWPDTSGTWKDVDRMPDGEAKNRAFQVYERLDNLNAASIEAQQDTDFNSEPEGIPYLRLSAGGIEVFQEWRSGLEKN